jgi:multisubunit Na+/H+ antiporter MnhG subunit
MPLKNNRKDVARHILPTAAQLLGLCFILLSFIKLENLLAATLIDESLGLVIILFLFASVFSYASMRAGRRSEIYERIADLLFLVGLGFLTLVAMAIVLQHRLISS